MKLTLFPRILAARAPESHAAAQQCRKLRPVRPAKQQSVRRVDAIRKDLPGLRD
jgi:hypothetical protein